MVRYGEETGVNLIRIAKKLITNNNLCNLLVNTDLDPLNPTTHNLNAVDGITLLHKNILVVPYLSPDNQTTESKIALIFDAGQISKSNMDNEQLSLLVSVYCPFKEWLITGDTLRPFALMSEVRKSLQDKRINGLGEIRYLGFSLANLSDEMGNYTMEFIINEFS